MHAVGLPDAGEDEEKKKWRQHVPPKNVVVYQQAWCNVQDAQNLPCMCQLKSNPFISSVVSFYIFLLTRYMTKTLLSVFCKTWMDEQLELENTWNFTWYDVFPVQQWGWERGLGAESSGVATVDFEAQGE